MGLFDRFKKKRSPASDYERLSALGDGPDVWEDLDDEELKQVVMIKCIEYGMSQDGARIPGLFGLYRHAVTQLDVSDRLEMLTEFSRSTEEQHGKGHMGLMMFLAVDDNSAVQSSAALSLSVLFDPEDGDELAGPAFVVRTLLNRESDPESQGIGLGGVLLLGDKRVMPLLEDAWEQLSEQAQLAMNDVPEFKGNVKAFRTDVLVDQAAEELYPTWQKNFEQWKLTGGDHAYHYLGSAIWFNRIGRAMGDAMRELLAAK